MLPVESSRRRWLPGLILVMLVAALQVGACSSSHKKREPANGQGGTSMGGTAGTGPAGSAGESGTGGTNSGMCRGSAGSPTANKGCGCDADCDPGEPCVAEDHQPPPGPPGGLCVRLCDINGACPSGHGCVELE